MVSHCCEMYGKFKIILFISLLLPCFISPSAVRKRRRPGLEEQLKDASTESLPDQVALATSYLPNRYITQAYEGANRGLSSTNTRNGNLIVNLLKENDPDYSDYDPTLADTKTAEEYVMKALQMHSNAGNGKAADGNGPERPIPSLPNTSFAKYEVYENSEPAQPEEPVEQLSIEKETVTRSNYDQYEVNPNSAEDYQRTQHSYTSYTTERYDPDYSVPLYVDNKGSNSHPQNSQESGTEMPKAEILKHIEESVMKYIRALEAEGRIPPPTPEPKRPNYRVVEENPERENVYTAPRNKIRVPVEVPFKTQLPKPVTSTSEAYYKQNYGFTPGNPMQEVLEDLNPNVEFVYKTKPRTLQKPQKQPQDFDDVHTNGEDTLRPKTKPKLYFNSETYHDINSLPYKQNKESRSARPKDYYIRPEHRALPEQSSYEREQDNHYIPISEHHLHSKYTLSQQSGPPYPENSLQQSSKPTDWHPYMPPKPMTTSQQQSSNSGGYPNSAENLPYDSYSPKYNNNPEGFGYQHSYKVSDMHGLSSSTRSSKTSSTLSSAKRGKRGGHSANSTVSPITKPSVATKNTFKMRKNREALSDLKPPPFYTREQNY